MCSLMTCPQPPVTLPKLFHHIKMLCVSVNVHIYTKPDYTDTQCIWMLHGQHLPANGKGVKMWQSMINGSLILYFPPPLGLNEALWWVGWYQSYLLPDVVHTCTSDSVVFFKFKSYQNLMYFNAHLGWFWQGLISEVHQHEVEMSAILFCC